MNIWGLVLTGRTINVIIVYHPGFMFHMVGRMAVTSYSKWHLHIHKTMMESDTLAIHRAHNNRAFPPRQIRAPKEMTPNSCGDLRL